MTHTINSSSPNPESCQRMSGEPKMRRSEKNAAGMSKARKKTMPLMTSFKVPRTSGYAREVTPRAART